EQPGWRKQIRKGKHVRNHHQSGEQVSASKCQEGARPQDVELDEKNGGCNQITDSDCGFVNRYERPHLRQRLTGEWSQAEKNQRGEDYAHKGKPAISPLSWRGRKEYRSCGDDSAHHSSLHREGWNRVRWLRACQMASKSALQ